ncbi:hypothetical protein A6R68_23931, partial [Neotoma lepida]
DLTKSYTAKRKQFRQDVKTSIKVLNKKLLCIFKTQQKGKSAFQQHAEILQKTVMAQKAAINEAKEISDQFLKNIKVLEDNHQIFDAIEQKRVEKEKENLKMKLTTE